MVINLDVALPGISPLKRKVKLNLPDDATVTDALSLYGKKIQMEDKFDNLIGVSILVNGSRRDPSQKLRANDRLKIFRPKTRG